MGCLARVYLTILDKFLSFIQNTNMINNSMHNLYARVNKDLMSKSTCEDSVKVDEETEQTDTLVTEEARKGVLANFLKSLAFSPA